MKAIFCLLIVSVDLLAQTDKLDSLQGLLTSASTVETRVDVLNKLSYAYSTLSLAKAEQLAEEALELAQPVGYGRGIAHAYNNLGICFSIRGAHAEGLDYFMRALRLRENLNDQALVASTLSNMARVVGYQQDFEKALEYGLEALEASRRVNDPVQLGQAYLNVGNIYVKKRNLPLALTMFSSANDLFEARNLTVQQGWALAEIAKVYDELGNYEEALATAQRAQTMVKLESDVFTGIEVIQLIGSIYHHMRMTQEASFHLRRAIKLADENEDSNARISARQQLAEMYKQVGKLDSALALQEHCLALNTTIFTAEKARQIAMLEKVYQTESKDRELRDKNQQLKFQAVVITVISALLVVLAVLGYISYHYYRDKRKSAKKLETLNNEISNKHAEILHQSEQLAKINEEVRRINESLEQEVQHRSEKIRQQNQMLIEYAYFNAHNVRGPLARILGLAGLMESESSVELVKEYNLRIHQSARELDTVVREINNKLQYES